MAKKKGESEKVDPRKLILSPAQIEQVEKFAKNGFTNIMIANFLGMSERALYKVFDRQPEVRAALDVGRAETANRIGQALVEKAEMGDVQAIRWYEMTRLNMSEKQKTEQSGTVRVVRVPEKQTIDDWNEGE